MDSRTARRQLEQEQNPQRNGNSKVFLILLLFFGVWGGCYYLQDVNDKPVTTSNLEFCSKHEVTYSTKNAYGGCPKCVKQQQADDAAKGLERKIYGK